MPEFFRTDRRQLGDTPEKRLCIGAECSYCHTVEWVPSNVPGDPPPEFAAKLFRARGWDVGKRRKDDTCPRCKGRKVRPAPPAGWRERLTEKYGGPPQLTMGEVRTTQIVTSREALAVATGDPARALPGTPGGAKNDHRMVAPIMRSLGFDGPHPLRMTETPSGREEQGYRRAMPSGVGIPLDFHYVTTPEQAERLARHQQEHTAVPSPTEQLSRDAARAAAEAPRQPTREDRRKIVDALDDRYDVAAQRYRGDATDAKLAEELKVPRAWVSEERERMYGPERNEAAERFDRDVADLQAQKAKLDKDLEDLLGRFDAWGKKVEALAVRRAG